MTVYISWETPEAANLEDPIPLLDWGATCCQEEDLEDCLDSFPPKNAIVHIFPNGYEQMKWHELRGYDL